MTVYEAIEDLKLCDDLSDFLTDAAERCGSELDGDGVVMISAERAADLALALQRYAKVLKSTNLMLIE